MRVRSIQTVSHPIIQRWVAFYPRHLCIDFDIDRYLDSPYPLDPFTFVSTSTAEVPRSLPESAASSILPPSKQTPQFAVPAIPPHVLNSSNSSSPSSALPKKPRVAPKNPFPEAHVPYLLKKVAHMGTGSLTLLVEAIYQDLKTHRVKKNAVEAKIRETCVKDQSHRWVVREDANKVGLYSSYIPSAPCSCHWYAI